MSRAGIPIASPKIMAKLLAAAASVAAVEHSWLSVDKVLTLDSKIGSPSKELPAPKLLSRVEAWSQRSPDSVGSLPIEASSFTDPRVIRERVNVLSLVSDIPKRRRMALLNPFGFFELKKSAKTTSNVMKMTTLFFLTHLCSFSS